MHDALGHQGSRQPQPQAPAPLPLPHSILCVTHGAQEGPTPGQRRAWQGLTRLGVPPYITATFLVTKITAPHPLKGELLVRICQASPVTLQLVKLRLGAVHSRD